MFQILEKNVNIQTHIFLVKDMVSNHEINIFQSKKQLQFQAVNVSFLSLVAFNQNQRLLFCISVYNYVQLYIISMIFNKISYSFAKIGFIGLGNMGFPMAINLAKKGHEVYAFDIDHSKEAEAKNNNITFRKEIKQVAKDANIFVTVLPNSQHSKSVCQSDGGLFKNANPKSLVIDCSTISPIVSMELNKKGKQHGMNYVDAPISGGVTGAAAGTLTFMVGAETPQIFDQVKPIVEGMGKSVFNCEKVGAGQIAKICNNMALGIQMIGVSQALALGKKLGIDQKILTNIMKVSSSRCWSVDTYNPVPGVMEGVPASRDYEKGFASELMLKDLNIAVEVAKQVDVPTQLGIASKNFYERLTSKGYGRKDFGFAYDAILNKRV